MSFKTQVVIAFAIVAACCVGVALALQCSACFSGQSYADCARMSSHVACTPSLVVQTHTNLLQFNPTLKAPGPARNNFYCFQLNFTYPLNGARHFQMGCTNNTRFCDSWTVKRNCTVLGVAASPHGGNVVTVNPAAPINPIGGGVPTPVVTTTTTTTGPVRKGSRKNGASEQVAASAALLAAVAFTPKTRRPGTRLPKLVVGHLVTSTGNLVSDSHSAAKNNPS